VLVIQKTSTSGLVFLLVISRRSPPSLRLILLSNHHGATSPSSPAPNLLPFLEQAPEAYLDVRLGDVAALIRLAAAGRFV
jgi:hypothetical protein